MALFFIYPGSKGGGLESTLGPYELAKELGYDARLFLSKDNVRRSLIERVYPEAELFDFSSPGDVLEMKKKIGDGWAFFTMISPKMIPLYFSIRGRKIFYYHATYDYSFSRRTFNDAIMDFFHDRVIKSSTLTLAPQHPIAWQVRIRLGKNAEVFPHPPYILREGVFEAEKPVALPFEKYFLYFGDVTRPAKGIGVLLRALEDCPQLRAIIAGKGGSIPKRENISHMDGWIDDGAMHYLVKKSQCVVLPYLVSSQFSGCLALSFHFGTPVIGSRVPTFEDWIDEDRTGWFFPSGDHEALAEKMLEVVEGKRKFSREAIAEKELEMKEKSKKRLKEIMEKIGYSD